MNDTSEIKYGLEIVRGVAQEFMPQPEVERHFALHYRTGEYTQLTFLEETCMVSFCAESDLLSQWRSYCNSAAGYAIGFRRERIETDATEVGFDLIPVLYERADQKDAVRAFFAKADEIRKEIQPENTQAPWAHVIEGAIHMALGLKNDCFKHEVEWRLISPHPKTILKYRSGRSGVVPYAEIPFNKNCVAEIWQGPTLDHDMTRRAWEMYLEREYGIDQVAVHESQIPLRRV